MPLGQLWLTGWVMRTGWVFAAFIFAVSFLQPAYSKTVTECGDSDGYAYYFAGGAVPPHQAGLRKDAISGGRTILNFENNEFDLILKGASGSALSVKHQGGQIVVLPSSEGFIALSVFYEGGSTMETYLFQLDKVGNGTVVYSRMVSTKMMNKQSLMQSRCL